MSDCISSDFLTRDAVSLISSEEPRTNKISFQCNVSITLLDNSTVQNDILSSISTGRFYELERKFIDTRLGCSYLGSILFSSSSNRKITSFKRTSQRCFIKKFFKHAINAGDSSEDPFQEALILQKLNRTQRSSNLVQFYEFAEDDDNYYAIMEYAEGQDLLEFLNLFGPMAEEEAKMVFGELLRAVSFCHSNGVAHRDISPENILYFAKDDDSNAFQVKLIDFGMATILKKRENYQEVCEEIEKNFPEDIKDRIQYSVPVKYHYIKTDKHISGKLLYLSPEYFDDDEVHPMLSDIWALGITLFVLITGKQLFNRWPNKRDKAYRAILQNQFVEYVSNLEDLQISYNCIDLLSKILRRNPLERYTTDEILSHPWLSEI